MGRAEGLVAYEAAVVAMEARAAAIQPARAAELAGAGAPADLHGGGVVEGR